MDKGGKPFELVIDLHCVAQLDKLQYIPREGGGAGTFLKGNIAVSSDGRNWSAPVSFDWAATETTKEFKFDGHPTVRYVRVVVTDAVRKYLSGREIYVFKVSGSTVQIPGDINQDGKIDDADLTSYMNYTGLRRGDADFDGYISKGDVNGNGLIDAGDISEVATRLDGGVSPDGLQPGGKISMAASKTVYEAGEDVAVTVKGTAMQGVNAINVVLPYNGRDLQFVKVEPIAVKNMRDMTNDRLHKNGEKILYPTFVNIGDQATIQGDTDLFVVHFKALRRTRINFGQPKGMLVSKSVDVLNF